MCATAAIVLLQYYHVALPCSTAVESTTVAPPAQVRQHRHGLLVAQAVEPDRLQAWETPCRGKRLGRTVPDPLLDLDFLIVDLLDLLLDLDL